MHHIPVAEDVNNVHPKVPSVEVQVGSRLSRTQVKQTNSLGGADRHRFAEKAGIEAVNQAQVSLSCKIPNFSTTGHLRGPLGPTPKLYTPKWKSKRAIKPD